MIFPVSTVTPLVTINPYSLESLGSGLAVWGAGSMNGAASAVYPTANLAIFIPFAITNPITIVNLFAYNGTVASGNIDIGIYDVAGTKIVSTGSTAQAGTSALQVIAPTSTQLGAGVYYMAIAMDNTTGTLLRSNIAGQTVSLLKTVGMAQMATAFPLPAAATFETVSNAYIPLIGLSTRSVV